ncbi:High cysteine membrane protein Group 4 [Giardia lamblia P15]|uniref:High cysteine membrane protein Group 4 n=1 Tax=Giardia intestinalis (strain P15) TaxID=658858 RepID=E1F9D3_GIAIA|nr:High cysteine membrane protein Group 4 [Giardia lamblia P15]
MLHLIKKLMLGFLSILLLVSFCKDSRDTYYNGFGVACNDTQTNCAKDRCLSIGLWTPCTQCVPGYVPINGTCQKYPRDSSPPCTPDDPVSPTRCVVCKQEANTFLFYGSCYTIATTQDKDLGDFLCSRASGGVCAECYGDKHERYVFTNPDQTAAEKCILCSDTVGFNGYKGVSGCLDCLPPITEKVGTALCARCSYTNEDKHYYPIDYKCQASGPHGCINGYCTSCYKTHLFYKFGCYSRRSSTGLAICAEANQYELDNVTICRECANSSYAPEDGKCTLVKNGISPSDSFSECKKDDTRGLCTGCSNSEDYFLFYGGCYNKRRAPGSKLCSTVVSGACTEWKMQFDFIFNKSDNSGGYLCGDTTNGGISGCATCSYANNAVTCKRCSAGYLGVDGRFCGESCSGSTQGTCSEVVEGSSSVKILSCRCVCKPTFYNNSGTCASCTNSCAVCKDSTSTGCQQCSPGKILNFSIASSESADCINQCVVGSECAECGLAIDGSRYCTRCKDSSMYPFNGVCILDAKKDAYCTAKANGVCTACSEAAFLMNGGCYTTSHYPGDTICNTKSGGKCTASREGYGISADGKLQPCAPECLECAAPGPGRCTRCPSGRLLRRASAAATGSCIEPGACADGYYADGDACLPCVVPGCRACGRTSFCTECAGELFVGLDGKACLRECSGDRVVGEVSGGTRRCWCERGFVPALDRSGCVPAAECPPGMPWCASCDGSGACLSCAAPGHNIQVDQRTCAEGCGDRASPNQGVCMCEVDAVLTRGACVSAREVARKRVAAIAGGTMAGVVVVGGLVGFLCWWFICRSKRIGASPSTTALVRSKSV